MNLEKISSTFKDMALLEELFQDAFPEDQLSDLQGTIQLSQEGICDFFLFYQEQTFLGFANLYHYEDYSIIDYFALVKKQRNQGWGSRALAMLRQEFSGQNLLVEIEHPDPKRSNFTECMRRVDFYKRNGYRYLDYCLDFSQKIDKIYDIYGTGSDLDPQKYYAVYAQHFGQHGYRPIYRMYKE